MINTQRGIASGIIHALSGPGGSVSQYACVVIDDDSTYVCAELPDDDLPYRIGSHVVVSYEDDGSERIVDLYKNFTKAA